MTRLTIIEGDALQRLRELPEGSVHMSVCSPPYHALRSYLPDGHPLKHLEIGCEETPDEWVARLVEVFREVRRVLRKDGVLFVNVGDAYAAQRGGTAMPAETLAGGCNGNVGPDGRGDRGRGWDNVPDGVAIGSGGRNPRRHASSIGLKHKDLIGLPWMLAFALRADGWYLRSDIIWHKPAPMPESVTDRCTKSHEYIFMLTKSARYWYDAEAIKEPSADPTRTSFSPGKLLMSDAMRDASGDQHRGFGSSGKPLADYAQAGRNKRDVWTMNSQPFAEAHFATYPEELPRTCIMAACPERCCAACGAGWVRVVETEPARSKKCPKTDAYFVAQGGHGPKQYGTVGMSGGGRVNGHTTTLGWRPSCECGTDKTAPGVCLDPFLGSGTTALVALKCGRRAIGIELNPEYAEMARRRCAPILAQGVLEL